MFGLNLKLTLKYYLLLFYYKLFDKQQLVYWSSVFVVLQVSVRLRPRSWCASVHRSLWAVAVRWTCATAPVPKATPTVSVPNCHRHSVLLLLAPSASLASASTVAHVRLLEANGLAGNCFIIPYKATSVCVVVCFCSARCSSPQLEIKFHLCFFAMLN